MDIVLAVEGCSDEHLKERFRSAVAAVQRTFDLFGCALCTTGPPLASHGQPGVPWLRMVHSVQHMSSIRAPLQSAAQQQPCCACAHRQQAFARARARQAAVAFSFNGGKDSTVLLHILRAAVALAADPGAAGCNGAAEAEALAARHCSHGQASTSGEQAHSGASPEWRGWAGLQRSWRKRPRLVAAGA
jgi:hypothetical protein